MHIKNYLLRFWPIYLLFAVVLLAAAAGTSKAVTTFSENQPILRQYTVIIDAGHGGEDGGATSCTGVLESQINLQIALRIDDLFHLLGYQTYMIRTTDISVYTEGNTIATKKVSDLKQRVKIVNSIEDAVLISIHQNTFSDRQYRGAQVFYAPNEVSKKLATYLQGQLVATINPGSNRKSKPADGIYLMQQIRSTGVLVECGFLSNPEEEAELRSAEYQKNLCCVIATAISSQLKA